MRTVFFLLLLLVPVYLYLGWSLAAAGYQWFILGVPFLLLLTFPFKKLHRSQLHLIYLSMGILSYLTILTALRDLIAALTTSRATDSIVYVLTTLALFYGHWNALSGPRLKNISVSYAGLPPGLDGLKIAQISDLHVGPTIRKEYVEKTVTLVNSVDPDIIALTGDIGDGPPKLFREDCAPLWKLRSKLGAFYVPGNHEYYWGINEWLGLINNLGIVVLLNRGKILQHGEKKILIGGIPDSVSSLLPDPGAILEAGLESDFRILLSHRPGYAEVASLQGWNLQLSGHTHGGQFFPWTIAVRFFHEVSVGLKKKKEMWLYVSPGTGSWGPLLRLGTTPEVTVLTLRTLSNTPETERYLE
ncbi:MAG TPA: metallophosphoesterase [Bacteriovoracaceae bacterium]|nr:metallophosphoesterase [Bacteriovoracaceae bacterium]